MKLLLDTHILLWTLTNSPDLPALARKLIGDNSNSIFFFFFSAWEVELKHDKNAIKQKSPPPGSGQRTFA